MKCPHSILTKINHWWFNLKCGGCNKRFRKLPKGNWGTMELIKKETKRK